MSTVQGLSRDDERFTRRLEAFSDIVIGFSLAQLGANLTLTSGGSTFFSHPLEMAGFLVPFAIICSVWFIHHRLFSYIFVPRTLPVILNFVWLAAVVLLVFAAEAYMRDTSSASAFRAYFACYAIVYGLLAVQNVIAMGYAKQRNDELARLRGLRGAAFMVVWTFPFVWSLAASALLRPGQNYGMPVMIGFTAAGVASVLLGRYFKRAAARLQSA
ncbi:MAG TPA: TMEM175 family protein [Candidatus Rubrimentiphilum sp.]|nr:TMEM175 family protein [Candidatus Rubrimentiphilum sp.]